MVADGGEKGVDADSFGKKSTSPSCAFHRPLAVTPGRDDDDRDVGPSPFKL
jgi:hypothetical protein